MLLLQCLAPFVRGLQPTTCLNYLVDVQYQISRVITPSISFLSANFTALVVSLTSVTACPAPGDECWYLSLPS